jgi:hypothetical protein
MGGSADWGEARHTLGALTICTTGSSVKPSRLHADWLASAHFSVFHRYDHTIFIPETSNDCIRSRASTRIFCMYELLAIFHGVERSFDRLNNFIIGSSACSRSLSEGTDYSHQATDRLTDRALAGYPTKLTPRAGCHGSLLLQTVPAHSSRRVEFSVAPRRLAPR